MRIGNVACPGGGVLSLLGFVVVGFGIGRCWTLAKESRVRVMGHVSAVCAPRHADSGGLCRCNEPKARLRASKPSGCLVCTRSGRRRPLARIGNHKHSRSACLARAVLHSIVHAGLHMGMARMRDGYFNCGVPTLEQPPIRRARCRVPPGVLYIVLEYRMVMAFAVQFQVEFDARCCRYAGC